MAERKKNSLHETQTFQQQQQQKISSKRQLDRYDLSEYSLCVFFLRLSLVQNRCKRKENMNELFEEKKSEYADLGK